MNAFTFNTKRQQQRQVNNGYSVIFAWIIALILFGVCSSPANAQGVSSEATGVHISILESNAEHSIVEVVINDYALSTGEQGGEPFQRIDISGTIADQQAGAPEVPAIGTLLGVATTTNLTVEVLESSYETLPNIWFEPAPRYEMIDAGVVENSLETEGVAESEISSLGSQLQESEWFDPAIYATDAFYPATPVQLGTVGIMRDQPIAQLLFRPVQFNPVTRQARVYRRIVARVNWPIEVQAAQINEQPESEVYEKMLQDMLLNYKDLARPATASFVATNSLVTNDVSQNAQDEGVAVKVIVRKNGLYSIKGASLIQAGVDLSLLDPSKLKLSNRGIEVAILVIGGEDGIFDFYDTILFYGTEYADIYTFENVYWLTVSDSPGKRMLMRNGTPSGGSSVPSSFPATMRMESDTFYWNRMPNGEGQDHWFWGQRLSPSTATLDHSRTITIPLQNIDPSGATAVVRVNLKGYTNTAHHTKIHLNGQEIDDMAWSGQIVITHTVSIDHSLLKEGDNILVVETIDTGAEVDQLLLNWIEIEYQDTYVAENEQLVFKAPASSSYRFEVGGFTRTDIMAFDITDPSNVALITGASIITGSVNKLIFQDEAEANTRYLALAQNRFEIPSSLIIDKSSTWHTPDHGADYIIITHENFYTRTLALANHRQSSGLRVAVVKIEDIYDEFNFGIFKPQAIRDFLAYAYQNWTAPAPTFVLLVGDARQGYRAAVNCVCVPTQIVESDFSGEVSSDNWFVAFNGDDIVPDMMIGRLSPESPAQVDEMVQNIIAYDGLASNQSWQTNALFIADDDDIIFEQISDGLAAYLPYYYTTKKVYTSQYPPNVPSDDIRQAIDAGAVLVNYSGHGAEHLWGKWQGDNIWDIGDIYMLANAGRLPFVTVANCLSGVFALDGKSIAEAWQRSGENGAIALWAPTSTGVPTGHRNLLRKLYQELFYKDQLLLGAATTAAKIETLALSQFWHEMIETYVLFGDPATKLAIPDNFPYVQSTTPVDGAESVPIDQKLEITFNRPIDPATFSLTISGGDQLGLLPTWNAEKTSVSYSHANFTRGQSYEVTVTGQDSLGKPIQAGAVPMAWSFTVTEELYPLFLPGIRR